MDLRKVMKNLKMMIISVRPSACLNRLPESGNDLHLIPGSVSFFPDCEDCKVSYINTCKIHGPACFIPDTTVPMGVTDRATQTLPASLEIQRSGIPTAGLGVFNKGEVIKPGVHFGPYQGDAVGREEALNSKYSWVVSYCLNITTCFIRRF